MTYGPCIAHPDPTKEYSLSEEMYLLHVGQPGSELLKREVYDQRLMVMYLGQFGVDCLVLRITERRNNGQVYESIIYHDRVYGQVVTATHKKIV